MPSKVPAISNTRTFATTARSAATQSISTHISSRSLVRSSFQFRTNTSIVQPPTFLLPVRANLHQAATKQASPSIHSSEHDSDLPPSMLTTLDHSSLISQSLDASTQSTELSHPLQSTKPLVLSKSLQTLLPALTAQKPHYISAHIHRFPYLVTEGDTLRLPFHMHGVSSGDILRLNRASILGSRDFTLKAGMHSTESYDQKRTGEPNYLDERLFECRARVLGVETGPMFTKEKTKRRNRKVKTVKSKHRYTVLKIMEVKVKDMEELKREVGTLLLES